MMSSVMPSLKYSFSGSVLMFSNGSTATDLPESETSSIACAAPTAIDRGWPRQHRRTAGVLSGRRGQ
jgi:hypothetical protein